MIRRAFAPLRRVAKGVARSVGALGLLWALGPSSLDGQAVPTVREAGFELRRDWLEGMRSYPGETYIQNPILAVRATGASLRDGSVLLTPWRAIGPFGFQTSGFYGSSPNADGGRIRADRKSVV